MFETKVMGVLLMVHCSRLVLSSWVKVERKFGQSESHFSYDCLLVVES